MAQGEAELWVQPIGEWGGGERRRALWSVYDGNGERSKQRSTRRRVRADGRLGGDLNASLSRAGR